jgi:hypothetical protein
MIGRIGRNLVSQAGLSAAVPILRVPKWCHLPSSRFVVFSGTEVRFAVSSRGAIQEVIERIYGDLRSRV